MEIIAANSKLEEENTEMDDRISQLPEDILSFILSFLSMKTAVTTRVLSSRWRYVCASASASNLEFDLFTIFGIEYDKFYSNIDRDTLWENKSRFVGAVDQFLQLYNNTKLASLRVTYPLGKESTCHIDKWVSFAVRMQVEKLELNFILVPKGCELYSFPCHLLPEGKISQLKHLCLHNCKLEPSSLTNCFNSLKSLELCWVTLDQSTFDDILSSCINVEVLKLKNCKLPNWTFSIRGRQGLRLKKLILLHCNMVGKVELSSIDVKEFEYIGPTARLSYVDVPSLEKLFVGLEPAIPWSINNVVDGLARDHPQLQTLSLRFLNLKLQLIPINMTQLSRLKELELLVFDNSDFDLLSIAFLLNAAPYLQKFHLALQCYRYKGPTVRTEYDSIERFCYHQLKEVEISGYTDKGKALELARHLINNAIGLERMTITKHSKIYRGDGQWGLCERGMMEEAEKKWIHSFLSIEKVKHSVELILL